MILLSGFIVAALCWQSKKINLAMTLISLLPLIIAYFSASIHMANDVEQATNSIVTSTKDYIIGWALGLPGAALFELVLKMFSGDN